MLGSQRNFMNDGYVSDALRVFAHWVPTRRQSVVTKEGLSVIQDWVSAKRVKFEIAPQLADYTPFKNVRCVNKVYSFLHVSLRSKSRKALQPGAKRFIRGDSKQLSHSPNCFLQRQDGRNYQAVATTSTSSTSADSLPLEHLT